MSSPEVPIIENINIGVCKRPLKNPYILSFATVEHLDVVWVHLTTGDSQEGLGEAVPLLGYGSETLEELEHFLIRLAPRLVGRSREEIINKLQKLANSHPFATAAVAAAGDFITWSKHFIRLTPIELIYPIAAKSAVQEMSAQVEAGLNLGYRHFKIKIGRNIQHDIIAGSFVLKEYSGKATFRFDANQAYNLKDALNFCREMEKYIGGGLLWLEQPFPQGAWHRTKTLLGKVAFPILLDESIYNKNDVEKAREVGVIGIKLKIYKHLGMDQCLALARQGKAVGLKVVLGNGVATDLGNLCEAMVISAAPHLFEAGAECNGYLKLANTLIFSPLKLNDTGRMVWDGSLPVNLSEYKKFLYQASLRVHTFA